MRPLGIFCISHAIYITPSSFSCFPIQCDGKNAPFPKGKSVIRHRLKFCSRKRDYFIVPGCCQFITGTGTPRQRHSYYHKNGFLHAPILRLPPRPFKPEFPPKYEWTRNSPKHRTRYSTASCVTSSPPLAAHWLHAARLLKANWNWPWVPASSGAHLPSAGNDHGTAGLTSRSYAKMDKNSYFQLKLSIQAVLPSVWRALPSSWQALPSGWQALPSGWRALPSGWRALPSSWQPLPSGWQALPSGWQALPSGWQALPSDWRAEPSVLQSATLVN